MRFSMLISSLPGANSRFPEHKIGGGCAFLASGTLVFWLFEHKIGIFVRFCPPEPPFSGISSTKLGFLCFFGLRNPRFRAFRAQNQGFCALLAFGTPVFRLFEHKISIFVLEEVCSGGLGECYSGILDGSAGRSVLIALLPRGVRTRCLPGSAARGVARSICWLQGGQRALF